MSISDPFESQHTDFPNRLSARSLTFSLTLNSNIFICSTCQPLQRRCGRVFVRSNSPPFAILPPVRPYLLLRAALHRPGHPPPTQRPSNSSTVRCPLPATHIHMHACTHTHTHTHSSILRLALSWINISIHFSSKPCFSDNSKPTAQPPWRQATSCHPKIFRGTRRCPFCSTCLTPFENSAPFRASATLR